MEQNNNAMCELQLRFTVWVRTLLQNARLNYIRDNKIGVKTLSLEETLAESLVYEDVHNEDNCNIEEGLFSFKNQDVEKEFLKLSLRQRRILLLSFVEGEQPAEIASILQCPLQVVYNESSLAIKRLKKALLGGKLND